MEMKLTGKQQAFKEEYCINGQNALQAAKTAKYKGNDNTLGQMGHKLVNNGKVKAAIDERMAEIRAESIANREQRQRFWTSVMESADILISMGDKLRASELLGKSEADFTDNIQTGSGLNLNFTTTDDKPVSEATGRPRIAKVGKEAG